MGKQNGGEHFSRFVYGNDSELMYHPRRKNMDGFLQQAVCNTSYGILTGGVFLSGYLLYLGLSEKILSYLASAQMICGILVVFFVPWLNGQCHRRRLMMSICMISRFFQISIIFVPLILPEWAKPYVVVICLFLGAAVAAVNDIVFNTWFIAVIPNEVKGRYFSIRQRMGVVVSLVVSLAASAVMDVFQKAQYPIFAAIYSVAMLVTLCEIRALRKIDDVEIAPSTKKINLLDVVRVPTQNRDFMGYMLICCAFYLFSFLSASFSSVFQLKYLQMSYMYINIVGAIRYLLQIFIFYKVWGLICDKIGNSFALFCSISFSALDCVLWAFMSQSTVQVLYPLINVLGAVGQTGFGVALFNRRYELIPAKGKVIYETFFSATIGITVLISPLLGGLLRDFFAQTAAAQIQFGNIRAVYLVSAILLALLQIGHARYLCVRFKENAVLSKQNLRRCAAIFKEVILRHIS